MPNDHLRRLARLEQAAHPRGRKVFVWDNGLSDADVARLRVERGMTDDDELIRVSWLPATATANARITPNGGSHDGN